MKTFCSKSIIYVILLLFFGLVIITNLFKSLDFSSLYLGSQSSIGTFGDVRSPFGISENFQGDNEKKGSDVAINVKEVNIATSPGSF